jgi:hypothetical protein
LVDGGHDAELHQLGDDGEWFLLQCIRKRPDDDGRLDGDDLGIRWQRDFGRLGRGGAGGRDAGQRAAIASALLSTAKITLGLAGAAGLGLPGTTGLGLAGTTAGLRWLARANAGLRLARTAARLRLPGATA